MSTILPGGFVVPFEPAGEEDPKFVSFGKDWRRSYESLRAISGSTMQWFENDAGFSRKFDLQPAVEFAGNFGDANMTIESVGGRLEAGEGQEISREEIYPKGENAVATLSPGASAVFIAKFN